MELQFQKDMYSMEGSFIIKSQKIALIYAA